MSCQISHHIPEEVLACEKRTTVIWMGFSDQVKNNELIDKGATCGIADHLALIKPRTVLLRIFFPPKILFRLFNIVLFLQTSCQCFPSVLVYTLLNKQKIPNSLGRHTRRGSGVPLYQIKHVELPAVVAACE